MPFRRSILLLVIAFITAQFSWAAPHLPGDGIKTTLVVSPILEERFKAFLIEEALKKLGYQVQPYHVKTYKEGLEGIAQGTFTYSASFWAPLHQKMLDDLPTQPTFTIKKPFIYGAAQGYLIDKKTAKKHNIHTLTDLQDSKIATLFDSNHDGKADLLGCQPDWGCASVIEHQLKRYQLTSSIQHHQNSYSEGLDTILRRFKAGKSVFYYTWTPHWISSMLKPNTDVVWLEVPFSAHPQNIDTTLVTGKNYGFNINNIHIISLKSFTLAHPAAGKLFALARLSIGEVSAQNKRMNEGENTEDDIRRHVNDRISKNQARFNMWIDKAMKASTVTHWP